jgi:DNA-binding NtrC family response regulator
VSRAALSSTADLIRPHDIEFLHAHDARVEADRTHLPSLREAERAHIQVVLERVSWNKKQAARILDISRGTLYRKIVEYNLENEPPPSRNRTRRPAREV